MDALPTAGLKGGDRGAARRPLPIWEPPPIYAAPVHVSLSAGKTRGTARCRLREASLRVLVRPLEVAGPGSLETTHPAQRSGLWAVAMQSDGNCVSGCWGVGGAGMQGKEGARAHSRGAAGRAGTQVSTGSPAPRRSGLTPPPARPGSGDSSRRALRAGRGRGRGRRRRRPPGRRGRRRTSGNP